MEALLTTVMLSVLLVAAYWLWLAKTSQLGALSLTSDKPRGFASGIGPDITDCGVKAATKIWGGQVVATDVATHAGYALPFDAAGTFVTPLFLGFADNDADNIAGAAGAKRVRLRTRGRVLLTAITGATGVVDVTKPVYASNDDTFTLTSTSNLLIGKIADYIAGEGWHIDFKSTSAT